MIRHLKEVLTLAALFVGAAFLLERVGFWSFANLPEPQGYIVQGLIFLGFFFLLSTFLFDPAVRVMEERELQTVGKREKAEKTRAGAEERITDYRKRIEEALLQGIREREAVGLKAEDEERKKLAQARGEGSESVARCIDKIRGESAEARKSLQSEIGPLAEEVAESALSRREPGSFRSRAVASEHL